MRGFESGPFRIDTGRRRLFREGSQIRLAPKAFDTLVALIERRDRVVEKDELIKLVWPGTFVTDDSLTTAISQLRRALGDDSTNPHYIETAARQGYRFIGPVTELVEPGAAADSEAAAVPPLSADAPVRPRPPLWMLGVAALALIVALGLGWLALRRDDGGAADLLVRFSVTLPDGTIQISGGAPSPDGRQVAFVAREANGTDYLWIRSLETNETRRLPGTEGAARPFWAPDSSAVGFFSQSAVRAMKLSDSMPRAVAPAAVYAAGGSWNAAGTILFAGRASIIYAVTGDAAPTALTTLDGEAREAAHRWPHFLPDGRRFLYTAYSDRSEPLGVFAGSLDGGTPVRVLDPPSAAAVYAPSGHMLFVRNGALMAQRFDPSSLRADGEATVLEAHVPVPAPENAQAINAAAGGLLSFVTGVPERRLVWFNRSGDRIGTIESPTVLKNLQLTPDRRRLLADSSDALPGVWVVDLDRGTRERITDSGALPVASPTGEIAYSSRRGGSAEVYARGGSPGTDRLLFARDDIFALTHWSPDGRYLVYEATTAPNSRDLWIFRANGSGEPTPFVQSQFNEIQGEVSPDGRWIAYASDESGTLEVYVQSFPEPGAKRIVSVGGGAQPRWRGDGRELFYLAPERRIMGVALDAAANVASPPVPLFIAPVEGELSAFRSHYVVTEDGQRFLIDTTDTMFAPGMSLIVNWPRMLQR